MTRSHKVLGFLLVAILGIYGCARTPAGAGPDRTAEAKVQRLEEDFRAAAAARDQFRQKLAQAEERQADLQRQLDRATASAAAEKRAKEALQGERDALQTQYDGFRRTIRDLLGQADAAMANPSGPPPAFVGGANVAGPTAVRN
jgi:septal ring factor EnvC (AmiA/AmiB activator)